MSVNGQMLQRARREEGGFLTMETRSKKQFFIWVSQNDSIQALDCSSWWWSAQAPLHDAGHPPPPTTSLLTPDH